MREKKEKTKAASKVTKPMKTGTSKVYKTRARRRKGTSKVTKKGRISTKKKAVKYACHKAGCIWSLKVY